MIGMSFWFLALDLILIFLVGGGIWYSIIFRQLSINLYLRFVLFSVVALTKYIYFPRLAYNPATPSVNANASQNTDELIPSQSTGVGIYILFIGNYYFSKYHYCLFFLLVTFSFLFNLLVIIVLVLRPQKKNSTDIFLIALATSDMLFAIAIHPMLIATSFGANVQLLFSTTGDSDIMVEYLSNNIHLKVVIGMDLGLFSLAVSAWSSMAASASSGMSWHCSA